MVYFIQSGKHVKIGYTQDEARLKSRRKTLQCGDPTKQELVATITDGGPRTEKALHRLLTRWRAPGGVEWFDATCTPMRYVLAAAQRGDSGPAVVRACAAAVERSDYARENRRGGWKGRAYNEANSARRRGQRATALGLDNTPYSPAEALRKRG